MNTSSWKLSRKITDNGTQKFCVFESETPYTVVMLIDDLQEAGTEVVSVKFYSDEKAEDSFVGGNMSPKGFSDRYDQIRIKCSFGMNYELSCKYNGNAFIAAMSDNGEGISYNKIAFSAASDTDIDFTEVLASLGVNPE